MVDTSALEPFAARATELLVRLAQENDPALARAYDELLFQDLYNILRRRGMALAMRAAEASLKGMWVPRVQPGDLDAICLDATVGTLERARRSAGRFDPSRGDGASWALGAAGHSYIDAVRDFYQVRRKSDTVAVDPAELPELATPHGSGPTPEQVIETRQALLHALSRLSDDERFVVLAQAQYGMSYAEIAQYRFGGPLDVKKVDRLLQSARRKLAEAERSWNENP